MRLRFIIAYDGAPFSGWQSQAGGNTIQDLLEAAASRIAKQKITIHGSGRTDAGVHAAGQCAHADVPALRMRPADWTRALNATLPPEIRILGTRQAPASFHARFTATGKIYRYVLWSAPILPPCEYRRAWHVPHTTDLETLRTAAAHFEGPHDFAAFTANRGKPVTDTVRTISVVRVSRKGPRITLTFDGGGFLYKMVRMLTAAAVRTAQGKESPDWIPSLLAAGKSARSPHVAPADGLTLVRVRYV